MDSYLCKDDYLFVALAHGEMTEILEIPIKAAKSNPARIDTLLECEANFSCRHMAKLMNYYAWHGHLVNVNKLRKLGYMGEKVFANLMRSTQNFGNCEKFFKYYSEQNDDFNNELSSKFRAIQRIALCKKPFDSNAAIMAARHGNLLGLKFLYNKKKVDMTSPWLAMAAYAGGHKHILRWLYCEFSNNGHGLPCASAAFYAGMPQLIEPHKWQNDLFVVATALMHGRLDLIHKHAKHLCFSNNVVGIAARFGYMPIIRAFDNMDIILDALAGNQFKVIKYIKFRGKTLSKYISHGVYNGTSVKILDWIYRKESPALMSIGHVRDIGTDVLEWAVGRRFMDVGIAFYKFVKYGRLDLVERYIHADVSEDHLDRAVEIVCQMLLDVRIAELFGERCLKGRRNVAAGTLISPEVAKFIYKSSFDGKLSNACVKVGNIQVLNWLKDMGHKFDVEDMLQYAIKYGRIDVVRWIMRNLLNKNRGYVIKTANVAIRCLVAKQPNNLRLV